MSVRDSDSDKSAKENMSDAVDAAQAQPSLAWLDDSVDGITTEQELRQFDSNLKLLKTVEEWKGYITSTPPELRIVLIVTGRLGAKIAPDFTQFSQIIAVYVYCLDKKVHEQWANPISKVCECSSSIEQWLISLSLQVKGVIVDLNDLKNRLRTDYFPIAEPSRIGQPSTTTTSPPQSYFTLDVQYYLSQVYINNLLRIPPIPGEKDGFIAMLQANFEGNTHASALIREFQESYSSDRAILWLWRDAIFHQILSSAFAQANPHALFGCRFVIRDMKTQLERNPVESTVKVYYGQFIENSILEHFQKSVEKLITFKSFLTTFTNRDAALSLIGSPAARDQERSVLLIIEADPKAKGVPPFAKIAAPAATDSQEVVVFMIGSVFRIMKIEPGENSVTNIHLSLCSEDDDDSSLKPSFDVYKKQFLDANGQSNVVAYNSMVCHIGCGINDSELISDGLDFLEEYVKYLPKDDPKILQCYEVMLSVNLTAGNMDAVVDLLRKSIDFQKETLHMTELSLVESYERLAEIYCQKKDPQALASLEKLLQILAGSEESHRADIISCHVQMGSIYQADEALGKAMSSFYQALAIMALDDSPDPSNRSTVYHCLGNLHSHGGDFYLALGFYKEALAIKIKSLPPQDPSIASTYKSIGILYLEINDITQGKENLEKAAAIYQDAYGPGNPHGAVIQGILESSTKPSEASPWTLV